jgi:hypothetical protein
MHLRRPLAVFVAVGFAISAGLYACDDTTFPNPLPVYVPFDGSSGFGDAAPPEPDGGADGATTDAGDAGHAPDAGDAASDASHAGDAAGDAADGAADEDGSSDAAHD